MCRGKLRWDTDVISPICLPYKPFEITGSKGYVAGWGQQGEDHCMTDNKGPARNVRCRQAKYIYRDKTYQNECIKSRSPTDTNSKCKQFRKFVPDFDWEGTAYVEIRSVTGSLISTNTFYNLPKFDNQSSSDTIAILRGQDASPQLQTMDGAW